MKKLMIFIVTALLIIGCGQSYEETKRLTRAQRLKLWREDSAALKIAVMPTLDCLPIFIAKDHQMFDTAVDIRLKHFNAQMDCDTALIRGRVEGTVSDLVRTERIIKQGIPLRYVAATNAYWLLISNRQLRMSNLKHLNDRMLAMTRYSVTDMLGDIAVDSAKLKPEQVFRIQVNDVNIRLKMLENNEMDALLMTEPQVTQALLGKHKVLLDTRQMDMQMGVLAFREKEMNDKNRMRQMDAFLKGYNEACDSINHYGVRHYSDVIKKNYKLSEQTLKQLPDSLKFEHAVAPRQKDVEKARQWLARK
ncbi:NitT/TauT family transport system substrate-binding protein [Prevotella sp. khp7]|uniref:ABC transporter substrate-binding protein n=1 Tax=Prevotella sp. khp7 TaxID=1761885 RepID=UPI0008C49E40|nr:NLPA lipoprotein [Prevotella sp. khp7]SEV86928.1 NitT/TauT family transport system substrate-binding protein [Prevotella sp. khp7]